MQLIEPKVIYCDNHLLAVYKPAGYLSQADGTAAPDILAWSKAYVKKKYDKPGDVYLGLVHRLDRPVAGVLVLARTSKAAGRLAEQIRSHSWQKIYLAICHDEQRTLAAGERWEDYIFKDKRLNSAAIVDRGHPEAKYAALNYECIQRSGDLALVRIKLETGRSHQIRVQFKHHGHPLYADRRYGVSGEHGDIALLAFQLRLLHPTTKEELIFTAEYPKGEPWKRFTPSVGILQ